MYTFDTTVRYSETGFDGLVTLEGIVNYLQDCTTFQSEFLGYGIRENTSQNRMWVLTFWQIVIKKYPVMNEKITVGTGAYGFDHFFGYRNFQITDAQGTSQVVANSVWVYMDIEKQRPVKVPEEEGKAYGSIQKLEMNYAPRKIKLPETDGIAGHEIRIQRSHIDQHQHVNNAQYIKMASDAVFDIAGTQVNQIQEIRAEYKKQAGIGAVLTPVCFLEEQQIFVALQDEHQDIYAVVWFGK
jgi:medium-chain acyl-[acyl-carrier-protein] hydrolase